MKTLSVATMKAEFSSVITDLRQGKQVKIVYGRSKKPLATIVPENKMPKPNYSIKLGQLQKEGWKYKMKDFEMTTEELLDL